MDKRLLSITGYIVRETKNVYNPIILTDLDAELFKKIIDDYKKWIKTNDIKYENNIINYCLKIQCNYNFNLQFKNNQLEIYISGRIINVTDIFNL